MTDVHKPEESGANNTTPLLSLQPPRLDEVQSAFPRNSRALATVALAVALLAGAVVLYMWKEMEQARSSAVLAQDELSDRVRDLESANSERGAELAQARQGNEDIVRQNAELKNALDQLRLRVTRDRGDWLLTEAEFLLSTANRKLRFEGDVGSATTALEEADDRLELLNDLSLVSVRASISRDLQALRRLPAVDRTTIALQISALMQGSEEMPLTRGLSAHETSAKKKDARPAVTGWRDFFPALWRDIKGLVTIQRLERPVIPLLPPEQRYFLVQNLVLKFETARIALLQRDLPTYQASLDEARIWMARYFDPKAPAVRTALDQIARLRQVNIAPALPDIGGSLRQLRRLKSELQAEVRPALTESPETQRKPATVTVKPKAAEAGAQPRVQTPVEPQEQPKAQPEAGQ